MSSELDHPLRQRRQGVPALSAPQRPAEAGAVRPVEEILSGALGAPDMSFEVTKGENVGIIGRNGAGKTTLLQILCGITEPTHGGVEVKGRIAPILALGSGFDGLTDGRENAMIGGAILGLKRKEIEKRLHGDRRFRRNRHVLRSAHEPLFERHGGAPRLRHLRQRRRRHSHRRRGAVGRRRGVPGKCEAFIADFAKTGRS